MGRQDLEQATRQGEDQMRFLVVGAGALGGLFGARLLKGGADVSFLVRPNRAAQLSRDGLIVKAYDGELRFPARIVHKDTIDGPYDVVLLACKAYDLDSAMADLAPGVGVRRSGYSRMRSRLRGRRLSTAAAAA